ncbi:MAG: alpha/beta-hydrolase family protein, partial [Arcanobacterium sp.]|nr:alpha/beta-hydrolase family protein [Arcanobacterium sp.]
MRTYFKKISDFLSSFSSVGILFASITFTWSLTPSLLPRTWVIQGVVSGLATGAGYNIGWIVQRLWQIFFREKFSALRKKLLYRGTTPDSALVLERKTKAERNIRIIRRVMLTLLLLWMFAGQFMFLRWQAEVAKSVEMPSPQLRDFLPALPLSICFFFGAVFFVRALVNIVRWIAWLFPTHFRRTTRLVAAVLVFLLSLGYVVENIVPGTAMNLAEAVFRTQNLSPDKSLSAPTIPERSGSPESNIDWDGVGFEGSKFLTSGASAAQLTKITNKPASEPIRIYAGLENAPTPKEQVDLLIAELERTKASDREAILLIMTTGTGWVPSYSAQAFELLYQGNTAVVAMQYSVVPSAVHFVQGGTEVAQAGKDFIEPIVAWLSQYPQAERPKVFLYGESLGTTGIEGAFEAADFTENKKLGVDGILLTGAPYFNQLRQYFTLNRDAGSTELHPDFARGKVVRFANSLSEVHGLVHLSRQDWGSERVLYLQNPSDPVAWWSPTMAWVRPQWIIDAAPYHAMTWFPVVSNLQMLADMPGSKNVPRGYGHNY